MFFKKNKNRTKEQTPVEWLVGYLKEFNCIQDTLSTRKAIENALKMERDKFRLRDVSGSKKKLCKRCKKNDRLDNNIYCDGCDLHMAYN